MPQHLLALELGPVVDLIASARKTRDLFFGSWMLSEIAKAIAAAAALKAKELAGAHCILPAQELLIVPAPDDLQAMLSDQQYAVGDEILLIVPEGADPLEVAKCAKQAAHGKWLKFAEEARKQVEKEEARVNKDLICNSTWDSQTAVEVAADAAGEIVEVYAVWIEDGPAVPYSEKLNQIKRLMIGRTACRNFPAAQGIIGVPKSSLNGKRESVLVPPEEFNADKKKTPPVANRKLRLSRGEQLDAFGVTKRVGHGKKNYPSTARVAADPWIRYASKKAPKQWKALINSAKKLAGEDREREEDAVLGRVVVDGTAFPSYSHYKAFPYEGAILYENRQHEYLEEAEILDKQDRKTRLTDFQQALSAVTKTKECGHPGSYYVAMVADGDRVGELLRNRMSAPEHRKFSQKLTEFSNSVRAIIQQHQGALIFAAGEDINALLPLDQAIECADALRKAFHEKMKAVDPDSQATLSVGLAIGHFLDALEDTLATAWQMEGHAKSHPGKNALAVSYSPRSGAPITFRRSWCDNPLKAVNDWIKLLKAKAIPEKAPYDLRRTAEVYRRWPATTSEERQVLKQALQADLLRVLSKKKGSDVRTQIEPLLKKVSCTEDALEVCHMIMIAGEIGKATYESGVDHGNQEVGDGNRAELGEGGDD